MKVANIGINPIMLIAEKRLIANSLRFDLGGFKTPKRTMQSQFHLVKMRSLEVLPFLQIIKIPFSFFLFSLFFIKVR